MKQTRRQFLVKTSAVGAGLTLPGVRMNPNKVSAREGFRIEIYATKWGYNGSMDDFCKQVKTEGYNEVEVWLPNDQNQEEALFEDVDKYNFS